MSLWTKSYGVTNQMKPLWRNFCMVLFIPSDQLHSFLRIFLFGHSWERKGNMECQHAPCRFHLITARLAMLFIGPWNLWNYLWHKHLFKSFFFVSFILLLVLTHLTYKLKLITMKFWKLSMSLIFDQLHFVYSNGSNFEWRVLRQQIFVLTKHKAQDPYLDDSFY